MTAPVSTLVEIGELVRNRPALNAPTTVVAGWYERKAEMLHHIADETGDDHTHALADLAHSHALRLLGGGDPR